MIRIMITHDLRCCYRSRMELDSPAWKRTPLQKKSPEKTRHQGSFVSSCKTISSVGRTPTHHITIKPFFEDLFIDRMGSAK